MGNVSIPGHPDGTNCALGGDYTLVCSSPLPYFYSKEIHEKFVKYRHKDDAVKLVHTNFPYKNLFNS